ncbi:MAG: outer membrane protein assembly factor BamB family protein [Planctomycetota bacterium]
MLRPSDGAPGEGGPPEELQQFVQKPAFVPEQDEPAQPADAERKAPATEADEDATTEFDVAIALDATDHLAPVDKAIQSAWQRANQAARQQNWPRVVQQLAPIIRRPDSSPGEDTMIRRPDGSLHSAALEAARVLNLMPVRVREVRERQLASIGTASLRQALATGDLRELQRVAIHFAGTQIGHQAADHLIALLVDRNHFGLAAAWNDVLTQTIAPVTERPAWQRRSELIDSVRDRSAAESGRRTNDASDTDDSALRQLAGQLTPESPEPVTDWTHVGGNVRRHAIAGSETPTLVQRWSVAATSSPELTERIDHMIDDLSFDGRSSVPVGVPLFIRGRMALRTLRGIEVRDVTSGQLQWTAAEQKSLERLLGGADHSDGAVAFDHFDDGRFAASPFPARFQASDPTGGALGQALFQNAMYGFLSSDGDRLFAISDDPVYSLGRTSIRVRNGFDVSPEPGSASANRLEAYDLEGGHLLWRLGGPETGESAAAPLNGWFFLGAPLATDEGLFVIAQNAETIRLFCLDAESGSIRWSQRVGWSDDRLDRDLNRRLWAALPTLANGVLVCPTSAGWVVGIDSATGTLLWAHRFSQRVPETGNGTPGLFRRNQGLLEVANRRVDSHWIAAPPVIAGTRVLLTPPETKDVKDPSTGIIVCLDLFSGRRLWELPRRDANQLATVTEDIAIIAGARTVDALTLDGRDAWKFKLPDDSTQICGRILASQDTLLIPTQSGDVFAVGIEDGQLRQQWSRPQRSRPPGSLYSYDGLLISVHPAEVTAFELQSTLEQKLQAASRADSDVSLLIQQAELALSRGDAAEAGRVLSDHVTPVGSQADRDAIDDIVIRTATALLQQNPEAVLQLLDRTPPVSTSRDAASRRAVIQIKSLLKSGRHSEAFRQLVDIAVSPDSAQAMQPHADDVRVNVSLLNWARVELTRLWQSMSPEERRQTDDLVERTMNAVGGNVESSGQSGDAVQAAISLAFHRAGQELLVRLARAAERDGRSSDAALLWYEVSHFASEPALVREAFIRRTVPRFPLMTDQERRWQLATLERVLADNDQTENSEFNALLTTWLPAATTPQPAASDDGRMKLVVDIQRLAGTEFETKSKYLVTDSNQPVLGPRYSVEFVSRDFEENRLNVIDLEAEGQTWSVQLGSVYPRGTQLVARRVGTLLVTLLENRLICLSIPERRILWSRQLAGDPWQRRFRDPLTQPMSLGAEWLADLQLSEPARICLANSDFICCRSEREITVVETRTGRLCWTRNGLRDSQRVTATRDSVLIFSSRGKAVAGYWTANGEPLSEQTLTEQRPIVLRQDDWGEVVTEQVDDEIVVKRIERNQPLWEHRFPMTAKFRETGDTDLAVMKSRGHFETVDLRTGQLNDYPRIPAAFRVRKDRIVVLPDAERWIVLLQGDQTASPTGLGQGRTLNAAGTIVGFARDDASAEPWYIEAIDSGLVLDEFSRMPFLILLSETSSPILPVARTRQLTLIDRRTGLPVVQSDGTAIDDLSMPGRAVFSSVIVPRDGRHVELRSNTERLRLVFESIR